MNALDYNDVAQFWNIGYAIKNLGLDDDDCGQAVRDVQHLDYRPVFGSVYNKKRDPFRLQAQSTPTTNILRTIHESIIELVSVNESWVVGDWHAMKSLPGGRDQGVHHDYPTFETAKALMTTNLVQASVIVALMDDTRLHVYPRCFGSQVERSARRTLTLEKGDVIFFRGDLAHAGAAYRSQNVRLHCYVCIDEVPQESDTTEAVVFHTFRCNRCLTKLYSRRGLAQHRRTCRVGASFNCPYCTLRYVIRNSLNQHIRRRHRNEEEADEQEPMRVSSESSDQEEDVEEGSEGDAEEESSADSDEEWEKDASE